MRAWINNHPVGRWAFNFTLIAILFVIGYWQHQEGAQAERALCALRQDLEVRVQSSEQYLIDVALGDRVPVPGITTADINDSIKNQRQTIRTLSNLDCN